MMRFSDTLYTFHPIYQKKIYIYTYIHTYKYICIYLFPCDSFRILRQIASLRKVFQNHVPAGHLRVRTLHFPQKIGARWLAHNCKFETKKEPSIVESRNDIEAA